MAWRQIYDALHDVPRMFQLWACKQVMDVAGTNYNLAKRNKEVHDPMLPKLQPRNRNMQPHTALQ